jgi:hypothetical protein
MTYTVEMAKAIRLVPKPYKNFKVGISDCETHIEILVKEEEIMQFSVDQRVIIMEYLTVLENIIKSFGIHSFCAGKV